MKIKTATNTTKYCCFWFLNFGFFLLWVWIRMCWNLSERIVRTCSTVKFSFKSILKNLCSVKVIFCILTTDSVKGSDSWLQYFIGLTYSSPNDRRRHSNLIIYDGSESPILHNSKSFHATRKFCSKFIFLVVTLLS